LGDKLWEIRIKLNGNKIARVIFFMNNHEIILVNGFIKKTQKTPKQELDLAKKRMREYKLNR
jgi:phage-related protein